MDRERETKKPGGPLGSVETTPKRSLESAVVGLLTGAFGVVSLGSVGFWILKNWAR